MITLKKYKSYFINDDGGYMKYSPPCMKCTEEKFRECLKKDKGCDAFHKLATERGWDKDIKGFDY
jgi:hypothetical protein